MGSAQTVILIFDCVEYLTHQHKSSRRDIATPRRKHSHCVVFSSCILCWQPAYEAKPYSAGSITLTLNQTLAIALILDEIPMVSLYSGYPYP